MERDRAIKTDPESAGAGTLEEKEQAVLVALYIDGDEAAAPWSKQPGAGRPGEGMSGREDEEKEQDISLQELWDLAEACDIAVAGKLEQRLPHPDKASYIGPGKVDVLGYIMVTSKAKIAIFDHTLTPTQHKNLTRRLSRYVSDCRVLDRTALILEIFEKRAGSREAGLQVEIARLQYMLPRLVGMHDELSRQGGGSGAMSNKGAGETQLELDRRTLEHRLTELKKELAKVTSDRKTQRKRRSDRGEIRVALVGYTNAGKSTLMNAMVKRYTRAEKQEEKLVLQKDMLFATLDTTVRRIRPDGYLPFLLSDTVGFISGLPHQLVEAFRSTLEEAAESDLLLHVVDFSDFNRTRQIEVTERTLKELGCTDIPVIYIYNKADLCTDPAALPIVRGDRIFMSAENGIGLEELLRLMEKKLAGRFVEKEFLLPYSRGDLVSFLNERGAVLKTEYLEEGVRILAKIKTEDYGRLRYEV